MQTLKGWRTILVFGLSGLAYLLAWPTLTTYINPQIIATATAILGIILRVITSTPVGQAVPPVTTISSQQGGK